MPGKKVGKYEIQGTLGEGTFGKVKRAVDTKTGQTVAIKILDKEKIQQQNMGSQIKKEISIMKMVKHPNVVRLYEVLASRTKIFIVLELITGGELFDKIVQEEKFSETKARLYFSQLVDGVEYCHRQGVCHRDLKPENLLLDENENLKISDFGLSALYTGAADGSSRTTLLHTTCGTPNYVAPEVLSDKGYDGRAADIWSMGVILYVLLAGFLPFDEPHMSALFRKIQKAEFVFPSWITPEARDLIDKILVPDPVKRINMEELKSHPWLKGPGGLEKSMAEKESEGGEKKAVPGFKSDLILAGGKVVGGAKLTEESKSGERQQSKQGEDASAQEPGEGGGREVLRQADAVTIIATLGGFTLNRFLLYGEGKNKPPSFVSEREEKEIVSSILSAVKEMGGRGRQTSASDKVKAWFNTGRGPVSISLNLTRLSSKHIAVEIQRGEGEALAQGDLIRTLRERLDHLCLNADGEAERATRK